MDQGETLQFFKNVEVHMQALNVFTPEIFDCHFSLIGLNLALQLAKLLQKWGIYHHETLNFDRFF